MPNSLVSNTVTLTLTACAVVLTGALVRREFNDDKASAIAPYARTRIRNGGELVKTGHLIGSTEASVKIVVFSDFQCPFCRRLKFALDTVLRAHPNDVALVFRHYPLPGHPLAMPAAVAAECASKLGRFKEYGDLLFTIQDSLNLDSWETLAVRVGITDTAAFSACRRGAAPRAVVEKDIAAGRGLPVRGTPAMAIGNELAQGAMPADSIEAWLKASSRIARAVTASSAPK